MAAKKQTKPAVVAVKIDAGLKQAWQDALARLTAASHQGAKSWDVRYEAVEDIISHQPPLYLAGGFASDLAFFKEHLGEPSSVVYRNMRVAKYATPADIETYSASRIDAAITWLETKNGGPHQGSTPIAFERLRIPVEKGGQRRTLTLAQATVQDLRAAIAQLKGQKAPGPASAIQKALSKALAGSKVKGATGSVHGQTVVLKVPLDGVARVAQALVGFTAPQTPPGP